MHPKLRRGRPSWMEATSPSCSIRGSGQPGSCLFSFPDRNQTRVHCSPHPPCQLQETHSDCRLLSLTWGRRDAVLPLSVGEGLRVMWPVLAPPWKFCTCSSADCLLQMWLLMKISMWVGGRGMMSLKCTNCTVSCTSSLGLGVRIMGAEFQPSARKKKRSAWLLPVRPFPLL